MTLYEVADYTGTLPDYTYTTPWFYGPYTFGARTRVNSDGSETFVGWAVGKWAVFGRPPALGVEGFRIDYFIQPRAESIGEFLDNIHAFEKGADLVYYGSMLQGTDGLHLSAYMLRSYSGDWNSALYEYWSSQWTAENVTWNLFFAGSAYAHGVLPSEPRNAAVVEAAAGDAAVVEAAAGDAAKLSSRILSWGNNAKGHLIKHADVLGFSGYTPQQLQKMLPQLRGAANQLYNNVNPALTSIGAWPGQSENVLMHITNNGKMLVTKINGEFVTVIPKTSNINYVKAIPYK